MEKAKNFYKIFITKELEEYIYEKALLTISDIHKDLFLEHIKPLSTNKQKYLKLIELGNILMTQLEIDIGEDINHGVYSHICANYEGILDATNMLLRQYCGLEYFAGSIEPSDKAIVLMIENEPIEIVKQRIEYFETNKENWIYKENVSIYNTLAWINKYCLNGKSLDSINRCSDIMA